MATNEGAKNSRQLKGLKWKTQKALDGEGKDPLVGFDSDGNRIVNLGKDASIFSEGEDGSTAEVKGGQFVVTDTSGNETVLSGGGAAEQDYKITSEVEGETWTGGVKGYSFSSLETPLVVFNPTFYVGNDDYDPMDKAVLIAAGSGSFDESDYINPRYPFMIVISKDGLSAGSEIDFNGKLSKTFSITLPTDGTSALTVTTITAQDINLSGNFAPSAVAATKSVTAPLVQGNNINGDAIYAARSSTLNDLEMKGSLLGSVAGVDLPSSTLVYGDYIKAQNEWTDETETVNYLHLYRRPSSSTNIAADAGRLVANTALAEAVYENAPTSAGSYTLKLTVASDGTQSFEWVAA